MKQISAAALADLVLDIETELNRLETLHASVLRLQEEIAQDPARASLFYENIALKLHNYYTGCERIFQMIAAELNGGLPTGFDWHKRLLDRMAVARDKRPAVISTHVAHQLQEYLAFRHVVRNVYGYELDSERIAALAEKYHTVWQEFAADVRAFIARLQILATDLDDSDVRPT